MPLWTPGALVCRICGQRYPEHHRTKFVGHLRDCVGRHEDYLDQFRQHEPFEGDPELATFAREEGDVWNRRPGTRKQPR